MTSFLIYGEDRERLRYVLVNRVRELQVYKLRVEELEYNLTCGMGFADVFQQPRDVQRFDDGRVLRVANNTIRQFNMFTWMRRFNRNGAVYILFRYYAFKNPVYMRYFVMDQWIIILEAFCEWVVEHESDECLSDAKFILQVFKDKKTEWTIELEGLRRELDHMGDKILALITEFSLTSV